jgi:hypothetical protein
MVRIVLELETYNVCAFFKESTNIQAKQASNIPRNPP